MVAGMLRSLLKGAESSFSVWRSCAAANVVPAARNFAVSACNAARGSQPQNQNLHIHEDFGQQRLIAKDVLSAVNSQIVDKSHSRLFAVVYLSGAQYKVTAEDLVALQMDFPAEVGSRIVLEKVLLVGGTDFTLVGRPLLPKEQVRIEATLLERTLTHRYLWFFMIKRKKYRRMKFYQYPLSVLRINSIDILRPLQ